MLDRIKLRIIIYLISSLSEETKDEFRAFLLEYMGFTVLSEADAREFMNIIGEDDEPTNYH